MVLELHQSSSSWELNQDRKDGEDRVYSPLLSSGTVSEDLKEACVFFFFEPLETPLSDRVFRFDAVKPEVEPEVEPEAEPEAEPCVVGETVGRRSQ